MVIYHQNYTSLCGSVRVSLFIETFILTVGPGGPTLPADPGNPVGPWYNQKHYTILYYYAIINVLCNYNTI